MTVKCDQNIWKLKGSLFDRQLRRTQVVSNFLKSANPQIVLDIGCAEGFATEFISRLSAFVVGFDIEKDGLRVAKSNVKNAEFIRASIECLPFRDSSFDAVTLLEILEHLSTDLQHKVTREVDRILQAKGTLVISMPYKEQITYTSCIYCGKQTPLWGHLHSLDESKVTSLLSKDYKLIKKKHLPNIEIISCSSLFKYLPLRIWLLLNDLLGMIKKGYWIILKYNGPIK